MKKENKEKEEMVEKTERQFDDGVVESDPQNTYLQVNPLHLEHLIFCWFFLFNI